MRVLVYAAMATFLSGLLLPGTPHAADGTDGKQAEEPCSLDEGPSGVVSTVIDGETIKLEDGTEVRLIGALAPRARDAGAPPGSWAPEKNAVDALSRLVLGKHVKLAYGGRRADRYGRVLAHVFIVNGASSEWVQGDLLDTGQARAYGLEDSFTCGRELLAHEVLARNARLGLWANGLYATKPADKPEYLMRLRGKYERVVGKVANVGVTKSATYLNFGSDWHTDFTVRIGKRVLGSNSEFAARLKSLQGVHVSVRGWIVRRDGPAVELVDPSELEILDEKAPEAAVASGAKGRGGSTDSVSEPVSAEPAEKPESAPSEKAHPAPPEGAEPGAVKL